jgi:hypothetical protein
MTEIDTTNTDPKYWEEILESFGLGERQLGLQEDPKDDEGTDGYVTEDVISLEDIEDEEIE